MKRHSFQTPSRIATGRRHRSVPYGCILALSLASAPGLATDTTEFHVAGAIVGSCYVSTENVELDYRISDFKTIGSEQRWVPFKVTSEGCDEGVGATLSIAMRGPADTVDSSLFAVSGVTGIGLQIQTLDGRAVNPDGGNAPRWPTQDAGHSYLYRARFMQRSASVSPGVGKAMVVVTVAMN